MENSLDMEFHEWEFIPNTDEDICALNKSETESFSNLKKEDDESLDLECKDTESFSNSKDEDDEALDLECKDTESFSNSKNEDDEALDLECKDTESFSNPKNEDDEALDMECKDIEVSPQSPSLELSGELDQFNDDSNNKESEEHDLKHDEDQETVYEYYKDEMVLERETEYAKSEVKEKQAFWTIGAVCSVAAATICIIVFAGKNNQQHRNNQQKLRVQLYTDEKRIKEVVKQAKMNHALSAIRGATNMTRARISFGGYYDGV